MSSFGLAFNIKTSVRGGRGVRGGGGVWGPPTWGACNGLSPFEYYRFFFYMYQSKIRSATIWLPFNIKSLRLLVSLAANAVRFVMI